MAAPDKPPVIFKVLGLLALLMGGLLSFVTGSVALNGTGAVIPEGEGVIEGVVVADVSELVASPVGEPFVYGEIKVGPSGQQRNSSGVFWSTHEGEARLRVQTDVGEQSVTLPPAGQWSGLGQERRETSSLSSLPIVSQAQVDGRLRPPYAITAVVLRPGDHVVLKVEGDRATAVFRGSREELSEAQAQNEAHRWPIVGLLGVMALMSFVLAGAAFRYRPSEEA